jgi:hypothetical protein
MNLKDMFTYRYRSAVPAVPRVPTEPNEIQYNISQGIPNAGACERQRRIISLMPWFGGHFVRSCSDNPPVPTTIHVFCLRIREGQGDSESCKSKHKNAEFQRLVASLENENLQLEPPVGGTSRKFCDLFIRQVRSKFEENPQEFLLESIYNLTSLYSLYKITCVSLKPF